LSKISPFGFGFLIFCSKKRSFKREIKKRSREKSERPKDGFEKFLEKERKRKRRVKIKKSFFSNLLHLKNRFSSKATALKILDLLKFL
jgi:hypothetical protein